MIIKSLTSKQSIISDLDLLWFRKICVYCYQKYNSQNYLYCIRYYFCKETSSPDSYAIIRVNNRKTSTYAGKIDCSATIRTDDPSGFQNGGISGTDMEYNCSQYSTAHTWYNHDVFCHNSVGDNVNTCIHFKSNSSTSGIGMFWSNPLYAIKID